MRIEAYNQVSQVYQASKPMKSQKNEKTDRLDQVLISSVGKDIQTAKQAVANSSDIREELTAPIKASINAGVYNVSADDFADKLLKKYEEKLNF